MICIISWFTCTQLQGCVWELYVFCNYHSWSWDLFSKSNITIIELINYMYKSTLLLFRPPVCSSHPVFPLTFNIMRIKLYSNFAVLRPYYKQLPVGNSFILSTCPSGASFSTFMFAIIRKCTNHLIYPPPLQKIGHFVVCLTIIMPVIFTVCWKHICHCSFTTVC